MIAAAYDKSARLCRAAASCVRGRLGRYAQTWKRFATACGCAWGGSPSEYEAIPQEEEDVGELPTLYEHEGRPVVVEIGGGSDDVDLGAAEQLLAPLLDSEARSLCEQMTRSECSQSSQSSQSLE